jgi:acyl carrier protein
MKLDQKLKELLSVVLEIPIETIDDSTSSDNTERWDSMNHMNIILAVEEEFGVKFSDDEALDYISYSLLKQALDDSGTLNQSKLS